MVVDLDALESAHLRARELGKIATLFPNLQPNAPVPESIRKSSHDNAPRESQCAAWLNAAHHPTSSLIRTFTE